MAKKYFYMFIAFFSTFVIISILSILLLYKQEKQIISNIIYSYQYNLILDQTKYKTLDLIKITVKNEYQNLLKKYEQYKIEELKHQTKQIVNIIKTFSQLKEDYLPFLKKFLLNEKNKNIDIIYKNEIIASTNPSHIGKTFKTKCFKHCLYKKDHKYILITRLPEYNLFIKTSVNISNIPISYFDPIINNLKHIPHIILYQNGKKITGEFSEKNFYLFDYFKPLKLFFGIPVEYSKIESLSNTINYEIERAVKKVVAGYFTVFFGVIFIFYLLLFTFFKEKIDELNKALALYQKKAMYDPLTKLLNREGFEEELKNHKKRYFLIVDLDNFKYVNDTFGHEVGDKVLKEFAWLLKKYFKEDIIGRWGGDEFLIATDKSKEEIIEIFNEINKKLVEIQKTFDPEPKKILSTSVGGCEKPDASFEERFRDADLALYKVKKSKKGNVLFFKDIDYIRMEKEDLK
jgi:diguanylate cyclase (GGDEF)-like protein